MSPSPEPDPAPGAEAAAPSALGASSAPVSLEELLAASTRGDRAAFAMLYDMTSARIYGLALRVVRDRHFAEEIVQECYLQYWQQAAHYRSDRGAVITWMMTIAHRRAVDRVRSEEMEKNKTTEHAAANAAPGQMTTLELVVERYEASTLRHCLDGLTDLQRDGIEMSYFNGLTYPEVAERMQTPLPTIKSRIRDGLRSLRECIRSREVERVEGGGER